MQVSRTELEQLLEIQKTDLALLKVQKQMHSLPQREQAAVLKQKKDALEAKLSQVKDVQKKSNTELKRLEDEDVRLAEKEKHAQELIDTAGSDYRSIESHTKELAGFAKQRTHVSGQVEKVMVDLDKVEALLAQLEGAIANVDAQLAKVVESYKAQTAELGSGIAKLEALRAEQVANVDAALIELYDDTARKTAGVAIGRLEANKCSVCRAPIEGGRLIELKANAPLGVCPTCKRLLVVDE